METINEFATKYAQDKYLPVQTCNAVKAGANYVLECLERAIELNESTFVYSREKYIKVQVLNKLIEQLKK